MTLATNTTIDTSDNRVASTERLAASTSAPARLVSIVVPTYQESENIYDLVVRIANALAPREIPYEVVVVDDNSQDGTEEVVEELQSYDYPVRLIVRDDQRGLSSAVIRGFDESQGEILICMDADLSHPPEKLPELISTLSDPSVDFVIGSRYVEGGSTAVEWGFFRWLNSKVATLLARPFTNLADPMAGFFAVRRRTYNSCADLCPIGYKIGLEILVKAGCENPKEIPIDFAERHRGESKLNFREQLLYLKHLRRLANFKYRTRTQLLQFGVVGVLGLFVDLTLYATFLSNGIQMFTARAAAIWIAMSINFVLNRRFTFAYARSQKWLPAYGRYLVGCAFGAVANWTLSTTLPQLISFFADRVIVSAACGSAVAFLLNFTVSRFWAFRNETDN